MSGRNGQYSCCGPLGNFSYLNYYWAGNCGRFSNLAILGLELGAGVQGYPWRW